MNRAIREGGRIPAMDEGFLGRVYRTSAYVWAFVALLLLSLAGWPAAAGWTVGSALSLGVLRSLEVVIRRSFVPGVPNARGSLTKLSVVKLPLILLVLGLVVWLGRNSFAFIIAFCAGVVLTQTVIFLKVLGMLFVERLNVRPKA